MSENFIDILRTKIADFEQARQKDLQEIKEACAIPEEARIYYPACGEDTTPQKVFQDSCFVYLDINDLSMREKKTANDILIKGDLLNPPFPNEQLFEVVIIISPGYHLIGIDYIDQVINRVKTGGHVICDNYHGTADMITEGFSTTLQQVYNGDYFQAFRKII